MPNCLFQFKQFGVWSHIGGFKVGTDAVLLGAWAKVEEGEAIIEVGSGTGVISLMLGQRSRNPIVAVELDHSAAEQTKHNFQLASFGGLSLIESSIQDFSESSVEQFDHLVCKSLNS